MASGVFDPEDIFATLSDHGVRFILIGGMAAILHGDTGVTADLDIVPALDSANLDRLAVALRQWRSGRPGVRLFGRISA